MDPKSHIVGKTSHNSKVFTRSRAFTYKISLSSTIRSIEHLCSSNSYQYLYFPLKPLSSMGLPNGLYRNAHFNILTPNVTFTGPDLFFSDVNEN